jgi:PKD repeat protein
MLPVDTSWFDAQSEEAHMNTGEATAVRKLCSLLTKALIILVPFLFWVPGPRAAELNAGFISDVTSGPPPLEVNFSDNSTGKIVSRLWIFGDGDTSTEKNTKHVFTQEGLYAVQLVVEGNEGRDSSTSYILVGEKVSFTYYPHIASDQTWETEVCIINTSPDSSVRGVFRAYKDNGDPLFQSIPVSLAPHARKQLTINRDFENPQDIGYLVFEGDSNTLCGYTKFFITGLYRVAIPAILIEKRERPCSFVETECKNKYVPLILPTSSKKWTGFSLVNTTAYRQKITFEFDNIYRKSLFLGAFEHRAFTVDSLFGNQPPPNVNSAVIRTANGVVGLELFGDERQLSGALIKEETASVLYFPHIVNSDKWWTLAVAFNASPFPSDLTYTSFDDSGKILTTGTIGLDAYQIFFLRSSNIDTGWLRIESNNAITGLEMFATENDNMMAGYTSVGIDNTEGIFPKVEKNGWTGLAFVNVSDNPANIKLTAYNNGGQTIATETINLGSHQKTVKPADKIFTKKIDAAQYIQYISDQNVAGFQLNGSSDGMMLDALPGLR